MSLLLALKNQASGGKFILLCVGNAMKGWSIMANFAPPVSCLLCYASCVTLPALGSVENNGLGLPCQKFPCDCGGGLSSSKE